MSVRVRTGGTVGPSGVWWKTAASQRGGREGKGEEGTQREREGKGEVERSEIKGRGEGGRNGQRDRESERQRVRETERGGFATHSPGEAKAIRGGRSE
jgi:hypothetical protein